MRRWRSWRRAFKTVRSASASAASACTCERRASFGIADATLELADELVPLILQCVADLRELALEALAAGIGDVGEALGQDSLRLLGKVG